MNKLKNKYKDVGLEARIEKSSNCYKLLYITFDDMVIDLDDVNFELAPFRVEEVVKCINDAIIDAAVSNCKVTDISDMSGLKNYMLSTKAEHRITSKGTIEVIEKQLLIRGDTFTRAFIKRWIVLNDIRDFDKMYSVMIERGAKFGTANLSNGEVKRMFKTILGYTNMDFKVYSTQAEHLKRIIYQIEGLGTVERRRLTFVYGCIHLILFKGEIQVSDGRKYWIIK